MKRPFLFQTCNQISWKVIKVSLNAPPCTPDVIDIQIKVMTIEKELSSHDHYFNLVSTYDKDITSTIP